jgi:acetyl-CoA carboxylase biotin carboxylase subunit
VSAQPFRKVLVANRGEIAVRVIRACRSLGVPSVAVHSEADARAPHVALADEAVPIGPARASESYLVADRILEAARQTGAEAVHPGYGFLSENGEFAEACERAGLVFIGPPAEVIRSMGDKVTARAAMRHAGVPVVPGSSQALSDEAAIEAAIDIGLPVLIKASAGGGGRGLRVVEREDRLAKAIARARSEAASSFGDDAIYVEKCIARPRHIEVQLMADRHGQVVHLFERECSVQRRHQKVLEEAPAHGIPMELRQRLGEAALAAARAVDYVGAGTVEFLLDRDGRFYFLEMNTRIQVEHAITEAITGVDLVQAMIRVAAGEPLPFSQQDLRIDGHAIEARVYAENPEKNFLPSPGRLERYIEPEGPGIRVDSGVVEGSEVTPFYDPMLAKLIAWGTDRQQAIVRLREAVAAYEIEGVATSLSFHARLLEHPAFLAGRYDTGFIEEHMPAKPRAAPKA